MSNSSTRFLLLIVGTVFVIFIIAKIVGPTVIKWGNEIEGELLEAEYGSDWEKQKEIENTLRSYISSYNADIVSYQDYLNAGETEKALAYKTRANRTATTYNEYYLKNSHIWADNVPSDIKTELPIIN